MSQESRQVYADADALAKAAAFEILHEAQRCVSEKGIFTLALAGGSTPRKLYTLLGSDPEFREFPWHETHLFFGDERHVPPAHLDSNFNMVNLTLLKSGLVPEANVHRVRAELPDANMAALDYDVELHSFFTPGMRTGADTLPHFDVVLLGMGPDGHTASLFPGTKALEEKDRWVVANWVEKFKSARITFTYPVINAASKVLLLVAGPDKTEMMYDVLIGEKGRDVYPVQRVRPENGAKIWMLDRAAAERLPKTL